MKQKIISKKDLSAWVDSLAKNGGFIGIREKEAGKFEFAPITDASDLRLDYDVSVTPPKKFVQPPRETLLEFKLGKIPKAKPVIETEELVIFGIHPYDMKAINQMDTVFEQVNNDTNYTERRKKITIVGVDPVKASKWSFWYDMNSAAVDKGFDLWLTDIGDRYVVEIGSKKGDKLISKEKTVDATKTDLDLQKEARLNLKNLCRPERKVKAGIKEIPALFRTSFENKIWEERAKKCYSCGSCNLVCPTCYCFDVREDVDLSLASGRRIRYWDGCLLEDFAHVGSGENFREERFERYRHRLMRKMVYLPERLSERGSGFASPSERGLGGRSESDERVVPPISIACVGCGRCSSVCLPDIADPVKIINELKSGNG